MSVVVGAGVEAVCNNDRSTTEAGRTEEEMIAGSTMGRRADFYICVE
jgi:hypothetical protein